MIVAPSGDSSDSDKSDESMDDEAIDTPCWLEFCSSRTVLKGLGEWAERRKPSSEASELGVDGGSDSSFWKAICGRPSERARCPAFSLQRPAGSEAAGGVWDGASGASLPVSPLEPFFDRDFWYRAKYIASGVDGIGCFATVGATWSR